MPHFGSPTTTLPPLDPHPQEALRALEQEVGAIRDQLFELVDAARVSLPRDRGDVHVHLLAAANELGAAERTLDPRA